MADKFHERFDIEVGIDEAKRRFVNRANNLIFSALMTEALPHSIRGSFKRQIVSTQWL